MESKTIEWCWLNGKIMPLAEARVSVEDRGFQFSDGVYEALRIYNGKPFELAAHLDRLERSCGGIRLPMPITKGAHRILNVHRNVPGVLRDINRLVSDRNANVLGQLLATDPDIGYLVMDLDKEVANDVRLAIAELEASIKTRILY